MTIASEITKLNTNLTNSYTACQSKGATMPANQNFDNLATCIGSIQTGGGSTTNKFNIEYDELSYPYFPSPSIYPLNKVVKSSAITKDGYYRISMGAYSMENEDGDEVYDEGYQQCYLCFDENDMLFQVIPVMYSSTTNDITLGFLTSYGTLDDWKPMLIKFLGVSGSNISYSSHQADISFEINGYVVDNMVISW